MALQPFFDGWLVPPGQDAVLEGIESEIRFGHVHQMVRFTGVISGTARDSQNTEPTLLRTGLILGKITATGEYKQWDPTASDGSEVALAILAAMTKTTVGSTDRDKYTGYIVIGGNVKSDRLIIPGNQNEGIAGDPLEYLLLDQLSPRFTFDENLIRPSLVTGNPPLVDTSAATTLTAADQHRLHTNEGGAGDITYTLPAAVLGAKYRFYRNNATQAIIVGVASGDIDGPDNVGSSTVTLAEDGVYIELTGVKAGTYLITASNSLAATGLTFA